MDAINLNDIAQLISTVGFPIFCAIFFLRRLSKQDERQEKQFDKLQEAIDNNTKVVNELLTIWREEFK